MNRGKQYEKLNLKFRMCLSPVANAGLITNGEMRTTLCTEKQIFCKHLKYHFRVPQHVKLEQEKFPADRSPIYSISTFLNASSLGKKCRKHLAIFIVF